MGALPQEYSNWDMRFTTHLQLVSKSRICGVISVKVKEKFTLEQAVKAQRRNRGVALLFL
jgi:hypothetical protein